MNLHALVSSAIGAVNPPVAVGLQISIGQGPTDPNGNRPPLYATPGTITASIDDTTLTVTSISQGALQPGQTLFDSGDLLPGTMITGQIDGTPGGIGTYSVSRSQSVGSESMSTSMTVSADVQALSSNDLRQVDGLNLQGTKRTIYLNGDLNGNVRVLLKGGDLVTLPDGSVWLVTLVPEPWQMTAGWTRALITLQNGS